jgi:hypothetical protein
MSRGRVLVLVLVLMTESESKSWIHGCDPCLEWEAKLQ